MCLSAEESIHPSTHSMTGPLLFLSSFPLPSFSLCSFCHHSSQHSILSAIKPEENCVTLIFFSFFSLFFGTQKDVAAHGEINFSSEDGWTFNS